MKLQPASAALRAYNYGRDGSFFANELQYIKSLFSKQALDGGSALINETYVRNVCRRICT